MQTRLPKNQVVLLGIGHTNAHILRMWRMNPIPDTQLVCVSNNYIASYSGMMPGVLAGQYPTERMEIDLARLCSSSNAMLIVDEVVSLDPENRSLQFADRPPLRFDVMSVGIGSVPSFKNVVIDDNAATLSIKPMQTFLSRLQARIDQLGQLNRPLRVTVVGGGIGGVEICFCVPNFLKKQSLSYELTLVHGGRSVPNGGAEKTTQLTEAELKKRDVQLKFSSRVERISNSHVDLVGGESFEADIVLWATGASAPPLLSKLNLPLDDRGFLLTDHTLRTTAGHPIFAVGDTGTIENENLPKAGVYAVRQGMVLWKNIELALANRPLEKYKPQQKFLKLLNTADGKAIAEYGNSAYRAGWAWRLKDFIDGRFMDKYQDYKPAMMTDEPLDADEEQQMRCAGCGGKIGGTVLSRVLSRLDTSASKNNPHVLIGLDQPDDVAVVKASGEQVAVTTDFFSAPVEDPYICGQMAALNSISDIYAAGATPTAALAIVTIPHGDRDAQEELLFHLLEGSLRVLRAHEIALVGGHTIEGAQLTLGFTVSATPMRQKSMPKLTSRSAII